MCKLKADCPDDNRCDSDTSASRTLRRKAQSLRGFYSDLIRQNDSPDHTTNMQQVSPSPITTEEAKTAVKEILQLVPNHQNDTMDIDDKKIVHNATIQLGYRILQRIEDRTATYPCPVQEDFDKSFAKYRALEVSEKRMLWAEHEIQQYDIKHKDSYRALKLYHSAKNHNLQLLQTKYGYSLKELETLKNLDSIDHLSNPEKSIMQKYFNAKNEIARLENTGAPNLDKYERLKKDYARLERKAQTEQKEIPSPDVLFSRRRAATQNTLRELGVEFHDNEVVYWQPRYLPDSYMGPYELSAQLIRTAALGYPREWIENSNQAQGIPLMPISEPVTGRAHYAPLRTIVLPQQTRITEIISKHKDWTPQPYNKQDSEMTRSTLPNRGNQVFYRVTEYEYEEPYESSDGVIMNPKPHGSDWELVELHKDQVMFYKTKMDQIDAYRKSEFYQKEYDIEDDDNPKDIVQQWRRPKMKAVIDNNTGEVAMTKTRMSQIAVKPDRERLRNNDAGESVATHELFHRITATNPKLRQLTRSFLHSRASEYVPLGNNVQANKEYYSQVYSASTIQQNPDLEHEKGYPQGFSLGYAGKEYSNGDNEVGNIGFEMLYFGTHGGFMEAPGYKADPDYHAFMIGLLVTSIVDDENN